VLAAIKTNHEDSSMRLGRSSEISAVVIAAIVHSVLRRRREVAAR